MSLELRARGRGRVGGVAQGERPLTVVDRAPRILHAPTDVGNNAFGLSRAERELGLHSDVAVVVAGPFGYGADIRCDVQGRLIWQRVAKRVALLRRALRDYDIIHFNFGQSFLALRVSGRVLNELPLIKLAGKTILVTFQGCDVRPWTSCSCQDSGCPGDGIYRAANAARFLRYADRSFYLNPDLRQWLPGSQFIPYASVNPRELVPSSAQAPQEEQEEVVVVHAPTSRVGKGTRHVIEAVGQLTSEGVKVRLDLVESVTHDEVIRRLRSADVVIDQLMVGWYGGFAVEAMALAKPVICHIRDARPGDNPFGRELPIVRATPQTLASRLRELVADRDARLAIGRASRSFVELRHDPRTVAREILSGLVAFPPVGAGAS